jgi:ABC-2 type transport system permease protein
MSIEVGLRAVRERLRVLAFCAGGAALYVLVVTAFWPSLRDNEEAQASVADYPELFKAIFGGAEAFDMSRASGFLQAWVFSLVLPAVAGVFAVIFGARTLAGEEEGGQLELVLSTPVTRRLLVVEKALALVVTVVAVALAAWVALMVMDAVVDLEVGVNRLLAATVGVALAMVVFGVVALVAGAASGSRSLALTAGGVVLLVSYVLTVVAELVDSADWVRYLSPYHYGVGTDALTGSWPIGAHVGLLVAVVAGVAASVALFERRDLAT